MTKGVPMRSAIPVIVPVNLGGHPQPIIQFKEFEVNSPRYQAWKTFLKHARKPKKQS